MEFVSLPSYVSSFQRRGWKLAHKLPSGGVQLQIHFTHRQSWAAISSFSEFLITLSAFWRSKPQKSELVHVCVCASFSRRCIYRTSARPGSVRCEQQFVFNTRRAAGGRILLHLMRWRSSGRSLEREQNMHTRRISAKCTLQNAGPFGL
jgi:hypothetical protein